MRVFADLHIHIGRTLAGRPVKITASRRLTLINILHTAEKVKGLNLVGIVDAACPGVIADLEALVDNGVLKPLSGGGLSTGKTCLFLGSEIEIAHAQSRGSAHFLAYFPTIPKIKKYAQRLEPHVTNPHLSTQRIQLSPDQWLELVVESGGVALAAHAFTPHKGVYGNCVAHLGEMFTQPQLISGLELGLSADTEMAQLIPDTHSYSYISSSDAHSLDNIGREFTVYDLPEMSFAAWRAALVGENGRICANHGMAPALGKYHRSFCPVCDLTAAEESPILKCPKCGGPVVLGVWDRVMSLAAPDVLPPARPPYVPHVPLNLMPGIGPKSLQKLEGLGTEIEILYDKTFAELADAVGEGRASQIIRAREGKLAFIPGGGGKYGTVQKWQEKGCDT